MDWKMIMSKRREKKEEKKEAEAQKAVHEAEMAKKEMQQYFVRLIPELNLRLLLDMESVMKECGEAGSGDDRIPPARFLWVDAITVTDYQAASDMGRSPKTGFIRTWKNFFKNKKERR